MSEIEIKISPFNATFFYLALEDSYRFGTERGTIYTPRLFNSTECENLENSPEFYISCALALNHEFIHKWLLDNESYDTCKALDNIDKDSNNEKLLITDLRNW